MEVWAANGTQSSDVPVIAAGAAGALRFARYAAPPNRLGHCGPPRHEDLAAYAEGGVVDDGLVAALAECEGAVLYLRAIACLAGGRGPLDANVVAAYWLGNRLLDRVPPQTFASWLDRGLRARGAPGLRAIGLAEAIPHHNFHVLCLYPWARLVHRDPDCEALQLLDRCLVGWGRVRGVDGTSVTVRTRPLRWRGRLVLGDPIDEGVVLDGAFGGPRSVQAGDWVSLHWGHVCDVLSSDAVRDLAGFTAVALRLSSGLRV